MNALKSLISHYGAHLAGYLVGACTIIAGFNPKLLPPQYAVAVAAAGLVVTAAHNGFKAGTAQAVIAAAGNAALQAAQSSTVVKMLPLLLLAGLGGLSLHGCASTAAKVTTPGAQPYITAAADVAVATAEQNGVSAAQINAIAKQALAADSGAGATLAAVTAVVNAELVKLKLPAGDLAAAQVLEAALEVAIAQQIGSNASVGQYQAAVADVLQAIIAATGG